MTEPKPEQNREWSRAEVETSLREILADSLGIDGSEAAPSAALVRDVGAESIDFLDIGFKIQQTLGVTLQTAEIRKELIAIGAAVAGHCLPCLHYHVAKAKELGVGMGEIREAIEVGQKVERGERLPCGTLRRK